MKSCEINKQRYLCFVFMDVMSRKMGSLSTWIKSSCLILGGFMLLGCNRTEISSYQIPKEKETKATTPPASSPLSNPITNQKPELVWALPSGWKELPADQMRVGHFEIKGSDGEEARVTIIPLPGIAGGDLNNVNRWREQISLPPITEEEFKKLDEKVEIAGVTAHLYDLSGNAPDPKQKMHILASMIMKDGVSWFFKMTGNDKLVQQQKPAFIQFLKSVQFKAASTPPATAPEPSSLLSAVPTNNPPAIQENSAATTPSFSAKTPANWQVQPAGNMLLAKYLIQQGTDAKAEITVSSFPGTVGGVFANVNRWRGQIGLAPIQESELSTATNMVVMGKSTAVIVDLKNDAQKLGMVAASISKSGNTWFYKLNGNVDLVSKEKTNFIQWVTTVESGVK